MKKQEKKKKNKNKNKKSLFNKSREKSSDIYTRINRDINSTSEDFYIDVSDDEW